MTTMEHIQQGLHKKHRPGTNDPFVEAVYELFCEYRNVYSKSEWPRLDACERMYQGDHWHDIDQQDPKEPRPTTPILFSTIENVRADLADEYPEAIIRPEDASDEVLAKVLTAVVRQSMEACDYDREYDALTHDLLVGGWMVQEAGWDANLNGGMGGAFLRHVSNKNILFDPYCVNLQDGRAVFKFDKLPKEWFRQHYPAIFPHMKEDSATVSPSHGEFENTVRPDDTAYNILLEAWFRLYDATTRQYRIHMVKLAGGCVLENSCDIKPEGYFQHGMYPFVVTPLYEQKGTSLGLGIVDMFKSAQQYSDKIDQIILKNALTAGHNRFLVMEDSVDVDDLRDYSREVIVTTAPPHSVMSWIQDRPLPPHIIGYMQQMRHSIKEESGTNDFSRGNVSAGITAASAITALQEMSSKRSRLEARRIHYGFKQAIRMMLEIIREFDICPRQVVITLQGEPQPVIVSSEMYKALDGGTMIPIEFAVSIKAARETRFSRISNNQMVLEFCQMFQGQIDPAMLMEAMDFDGQELILEKLRASQGQGMGAIKQQVQELGNAMQQMEQELQTKETENEALRNALLAAKRIIGGTPFGLNAGMTRQAGQSEEPAFQGLHGMPLIQSQDGQELPPELMAQMQSGQELPPELAAQMQGGQELPPELVSKTHGGQELPPELMSQMQSGQELPPELMAMLGGAQQNVEDGALPPLVAEKAAAKEMETNFINKKKSRKPNSLNGR